MKSRNLRETIYVFFWVDLSISGGNGQSIDDPILIDVAEDWVSLEYKIIGFIQQLGNKIWRMEKQELIKKGNKYIDKISIVLDDDQTHYHNYYFDITKTYKRWQN